MNTAHTRLAQIARNKGEAIEFAASSQDWNAKEQGNPFHTLLAHAHPNLVADTLRFRQYGQATKPPAFLEYSQMKKSGTLERCVDTLDPSWLEQTRTSDGATPLHILFRKIIRKEAWFKPQDARMNGNLVQFGEHSGALADAWYLAGLFEKIGGDFSQEDATGTSLADLIVEADHSLNPEYRVSSERQELRKLEAFVQAKVLERHTVDNQQRGAPRERL